MQRILMCQIGTLEKSPLMAQRELRARLQLHLERASRGKEFEAGFCSVSTDDSLDPAGNSGQENIRSDFSVERLASVGSPPAWKSFGSFLSHGLVKA